MSVIVPNKSKVLNSMFGPEYSSDNAGDGPIENANESKRSKDTNIFFSFVHEDKFVLDRLLWIPVFCNL